MTTMLWMMALASLAGETGSVAGTVTYKGKTPGPVVVYVEGTGPAPEPLDGPAEVIQDDMRFDPHGLVIPPGTVVTFPNRDNRFHNAFSHEPVFDLGSYNYGESRSHTFEEPGVVDVYCNEHVSMSMQILVVPNAHFAQVDDKGRFALEGLPVGKHRLTAWTPDHLMITKEVRVQDGESTSVDFLLERDLTNQGHLNKEGMHYPDRGAY